MSLPPKRWLAAVLLWAVSVQAAAIGLGEIRVQSFLNQPFAAVIPVMLEPGREPAEIEAALGSPELFARLGLEYPVGLEAFRARIGTWQGRPAIRISGRRPMKLAAFELAVRLRWSGGHLVRTYAVLLDPPGAAPAVPVSHQERGRAAADPSPASTRRVQAGETLGTIAAELGAERGVDRGRMALALYRMNPEAFIGGNMNGLRRGAELTVPSPGVLTGISRVDARRAVNEHGRLWRGAQESPKPDRGAESGSVRPPTRVQEPVALRILPETPDSQPSAGGGELRRRLRQVHEANADLSRQNRRLREELVVLEEQVRLMTERVLALPARAPSEPPSVVAGEPEQRPAVRPLTVAAAPLPPTSAVAPWWQEPLWWGVVLLVLVTVGLSVFAWRLWHREAEPYIEFTQALKNECAR